jgi:hypothetical protein
MFNDPFSKHYWALTAPERFALLVEAMARGDEADADRLEDSCPVLTYRGEDTAFRGRMVHAHLIAVRVCLNLRAGLAELRMADTFRRTCRSFAAAGPVNVAQASFMAGRAYGRAEVTGEAEPKPPREQLWAEIAADPELTALLDEARDLAEQGVERVADTLLYATTELHAADLLAQWQGFGRFCRDRLGLEPGVVFAAFGLEPRDVEAEVLSRCPDAVAGEKEVTEWAGRWTRPWDRRFS